LRQPAVRECAPDPSLLDVAHAAGCRDHTENPAKKMPRFCVQHSEPGTTAGTASASMHTVSSFARTLLVSSLMIAAPLAHAGNFRDDFSNSSSGWAHAAATSDQHRGFAVYTDSAQYQMTPVQDDTFGFAPAPQQLGGEVSVNADLFLYAGVGRGGAGLACRYRDPANFDAALARGDGKLVLIRVRDGQAELLAGGPVESVIPGSIDTRIELRCSGDRLSAHTREGLVIEAASAGPVEGQSGLLVIGEAAAGTSAVFDNFELRALQ
jgi:hypothetical protein